MTFVAVLCCGICTCMHVCMNVCILLILFCNKTSIKIELSAISRRSNCEYYGWILNVARAWISSSISFIFCLPCCSVYIWLIGIYILFISYFSFDVGNRQQQLKTLGVYWNCEINIQIYVHTYTHTYMYAYVYYLYTR